MGIDIGVIVTIGLSFISILLTINIFILQGVGKRIDLHEETLKERGKILGEMSNRITILETEFNVYKNKK